MYICGSRTGRCIVFAFITALTIFVLAPKVSFADTVILDDMTGAEYQGTGIFWGWSGVPGTRQFIGSQFLVDNYVTRTDDVFNKIRIGISKTDNSIAEGGAYIQIYNFDDMSLVATSNEVPVSILPTLSQAFPPSGLPHSFSKVDVFPVFTFPNTVTLFNGGRYYIIIRRTSLPLTPNSDFSDIVYYPLQMENKTFSYDTNNCLISSLNSSSLDINPCVNTGDYTIPFQLIQSDANSSCTVDCNSNILFLPGYEASRLYQPDAGGGEVRLWEASGDTNALNLSLDANGKAIQKNIYTRDVVDSGYGFYGLYDGFLSALSTLKSSGEINDWEAIPYDWRLSIDDILNGGNQTGKNISYTVATDTPYLLQELKKLAVTSKSRKVTIVAHSNGGLVAKALTEKLGADASKYIDKIVFVGVPQIGTPQAIASLLHGDEQGEPNDTFPLTLSKGVARVLGENSPGAYNLLPSTNYFTYVDTPVITISNSTLPTWSIRYGEVIHSEERLLNFLTDTIGRSKPATSDTRDPNILNAGLLTQAQSVHDDLDAWTPPVGIQLIQIAGWGDPVTLSTINYSRATYLWGAISLLDSTPSFVSDGDGVVPVPSALWTAVGPNVSNYYLNLDAYNKKRNTYFAAQHANMLDVPALDSFISDIITGSQKTLDSYGYLSVTPPIADSQSNRLEYILRAPQSLGLDVYTNVGHTGISTSTNSIEEQTPGSYYKTFGDSRYIFTEEGASQDAVVTSSTSTKFTLTVNEIRNNLIVASTTFKDIPVTPHVSAHIHIPSTLSSESNLDIVTDGAVTGSVSPKLNDTATVDVTPPVTKVSLVGTAGLHGWFTSSVVVTFSATDTDSGVKTTYVSIDGSATTSAGTITLSTEGVHKLTYFSADVAGNTEAATSTIIKIDKTPPEAKIVFNPSTQAIEVSGIDSLSSTSVRTTSTSSIVTDDAGHTLQVGFSRYQSGFWRDEVGINKLTYDGVSTSVTARLQYKSLRWINKSYLLFVARATTSTQDVESHFRPKKNQTYIMTKTQDIDDSENDDWVEAKPVTQKLSGMIIPYLQTGNKAVKVFF